MSVEKAELKRLIITEVGAVVEQLEKSAEQETANLSAIAGAFALAADEIHKNLAGHVDRDLDRGDYGLETAEVVKRYIDRAANAIRSLAAKAENNTQTARGRQSAFSDVGVRLEKMFRDEDAKTRLAAPVTGPIAVEGTGPERHQPGQRPGPTLKQQRQAEETPKEAKPKARRRATAKPKPKPKPNGKGEGHAQDARP